MQRSKIKVGETYVVEIDGLSAPQEMKTYGDPVHYLNGFTMRGVSRNYGKRAEAIVKQFDCKRPARCYGSHWSFVNDGVLVEFVEPQKTGWNGNAPVVTTAVLSTKHILKLASQAREEKAKAEKWAKIHRDNAAEKAAAFRPQIDALLNADTHLKIAEGERGITITSPGGNESALVRFETSRHGSEEFVTGWSWRKVEIDRGLLFNLIGV